MRLIRLEVRHLPGIDRPFAVDFAPETVNLITGPNGSGKSSVVRAVRALIHVGRDDPHIELGSLWQDSDGQLSCERNGHNIQWRRRGQSIQPPRLPGREAIGAYLINSEDLSAPGRTDAHIAEELQTLLSGGYDLVAVLAAPPFAPPPRPQKLARDFETMQRTIAEKEAEYAALQEEMEKLGRLEAALEQASRSASLIGPIADASALAEAYSARAALEVTLTEEFPDGMERLRGDETQRLDQARARLQQKQQILLLERDAQARDQSRLDQSSGNDPAGLETMQAELAEARHALATTEQQLADGEERIGLAQEAAARAANRLGSAQPDQIDRLDQAALEALERQVEKVLSQREKIRALSGQLVLARASRNPSGRPADDLRLAHRVLQDWLALARLNPLEGALWGSLGLAALLASARLLNIAALASSPELLLLATLAAGLPVAMLARFLFRLRDREKARSQFLQTSVEPPLGWNESEVRARIERLEIELEAARQHEVSQTRAGELREQLNAHRISLERSRDKLKDLADTLGISADPRLETGFLLWCRHLHDWQHEHQKLNEQRLRRNTLQQLQKQQIQEAAQLLADHGIDDAEISSRKLASLVHQLQPRIRRSAELHNNIQARERRLQELSADVAQIQRQISLLFEQADIRNNDIPLLRTKVDQHPAWLQLEQQRRDLGHEIARLEKRLQGHQELLEQARDQRHTALETSRQEHTERAEQRDALNRQIAEIRTRHAEALKRRDLERLGAELEQLRERLGAELDAQMIAAAGHFLIEEARAAYRLEHEPALLAAADRWLDSFTRHRYRLLFQDGEFFAIDTHSGRRLPIRELSTGGRAQFMLAVRLAWIEQQEQQSEPLPVFMDEVLTTSDADRYRAVVSAVRALIDNGRQLFYLTAQSDDAQAWSDWLGDDLAPNAIDMGEIRAGEVRQLEFRMPDVPRQPEVIPDPEQMPLEQWAKAVHVDAIDPWQDAGRIHIAHLLSDHLPTASRLMEVGIKRLGELERLLQHSNLNSAARTPVNAADAETLAGRAQAARLIVQDWRRHHDRPIDSVVLQATGLLTDRFVTQVVELADQVGGDPRRLLERLGGGAVPRFRSDVTDQLRQWLTDHGYLRQNELAAALTAAELSLETGLQFHDGQIVLDALHAAIADPLQQSTPDNPEA